MDENRCEMQSQEDAGPVGGEVVALLPCPFCGNEEGRPPGSLSYAGNSIGKWGWVECGCGARGPDVQTGFNNVLHWAGAAGAEWNRRAVPPTGLVEPGERSNTDPQPTTTSAPSSDPDWGHKHQYNPPSPPGVVDYTTVTAAGIVGDWQDKWNIDQEQFNAALDDLELEVRRALSAVASEHRAARTKREAAFSAALDRREAVIRDVKAERDAALQEARADFAALMDEASAEIAALEAKRARLREPDVREAVAHAIGNVYTTADHLRTWRAQADAALAVITGGEPLT